MITTIPSNTDAPVNKAVETKEKKPAAAPADFQNFLSLLTAQLRHQDPLSPLDSTQFVEQLASFSSVEQQIETNRRLEELASSMNVSGLEGASQWIGKDVEARVDGFDYDGKEIEFQAPPASAGVSREVVIRNENDKVVFLSELEADQDTFSWSGEDSLGNALPNAGYSIAVKFSKDGLLIDTKSPTVISRVTQARLADGAVQLGLSNGAAIAVSAITAVREVELQDVSGA